MNKIPLLITQVLLALVMAAAAASKFLDASQSIETFTMLGMEPHGRFIIAILEGGAALLLLSPQSAAGGLLSLGILSGAGIAMLTHLPFDSTHFLIWVFAILAAGFITWERRGEVPLIGQSFRD